MSAGSPALDPTPTELEDLLDFGWLTAALDDVAPDERVVAVEQLDRTKTLASKIRIAVTIEAPNGSRRTRAYCVKAHFGGGPETLRSETHVYRELSPLLDVRTPRAYYTGIDEARGRSLIIMDDVGSLGGRFLSAHQPYSIDTCRDSVSQLARLHAATWADPRWEVDWLDPRMTTTATLFSTDYLQALLDDGRGEQVAADLLDAERLQAAVARTADLPPTCIIHGDTHSGNVYLDAEGRACWLDWQVTQRGHWSVDVAYHLATVLSIEDRRTHERELLGAYLDELIAAGATDAPSWDEAWERYTLGFSWGYLLWVITQISSREVVMLHMPRLGAALSDHDTWTRLGV
jgi:aminoglycoside phosphotransferase (APT) family kinase protein